MIYMEKYTIRVGQGFDLHRLVPGRRLILGGIAIPFDMGLSGHSDADVLLHAVCDALLGAAGLGDIGRHFPDHDARYKDISSSFFVEQICAMILDRGLPKIEPYSREIEDNLANLLKTDRSAVNVKAKTMERLGPIGRGEAIGAECIVSLFVRD